MWKHLLFAAALFAGLFFSERALSHSEQTARAAGVKIGRLVPKEEREGKPVAALKVELGGQAFVYANEQGVWRCVSYRGANGSEEKIKSVLSKLFEAEGTIQSVEKARAGVFGLDGPGSARITCMGPKTETLFAFDLGKPVESGEGCFVRRVGEPKVWRVDTNPWPELERPVTGLPPLLDPSIVPAIWPGESRMIQEIEVERADGRRFKLVLHNLDVSPEEMREGKQPFEWLLHEGAAEPVVCVAFLGVGYTSFPQRAPYQEVLAGAEAQKLGFERPRARVTLKPAKGEPAELLLAPETVSGQPAVFSSASKLAYRVTKEVADLLWPTPEQLLPPTTANPWDPYMRR